MLAVVDTEFAGQEAQRAGPSSDLYLPAEHSEHVFPFAPVYPALHWHAVFMMLAAAETEFDGQDVQMAGPNSDLYVSTKHGEQ